MYHFKFLGKIDSFVKNVSSVLDNKKGSYIFEEPLNLHILLVNYFFRCGSQEKIEPSWINYLICLFNLVWFGDYLIQADGEHNTPNTQNIYQQLQNASD